jgi:shikimate dehydrogenase
VKAFGVVGHPIGHSRSPEIHGQFALQCKLDIDYLKFDIEPEKFHSFVSEFFANGGVGLNITVPFKEHAFRLSTPASEKVKLSKAVNTLFLNKNGELVGDNTDGPGLVKDLLNNGIVLEQKRLLILGAGGAARGILPSLIEKSPSSITIANRTIEKAEQLQQEFSHLQLIEVVGFEDFDELGGEPYDVIINATSLGIQGKTPNISSKAVKPSTCCYDLMYSSDDTAFVKWALDNKAKKAIDGLGMLVEQAAVSFEIWLGAIPDTRVVIDRIRLG